MSTQPDRHEKIASILTHYFKRIGEASGLRWSQKNEADMERLAALLCNDLREALPASEEREEEELPPMSDREWLGQRAEAVGFTTARPRRR